MTPGPCSALDTFPGPVHRACLWTVTGACVRRNETDVVAHACKGGAHLFLSIRPHGPPRPALLPNKGFWMAVKLPLDSGSLDILTSSASWDEPSAWVKTDVLGIAMVLFLAVLLLLIGREKPRPLGPWCIFHPPSVTVHIRQLSLSVCPWERVAFRKAFFSHASKLLFMNGTGAISVQRVIVIPIIIIPIIMIPIIIYSASHHFQNVIWSFVLTVSLWGS